MVLSPDEKARQRVTTVHAMLDDDRIDVDQDEASLEGGAFGHERHLTGVEGTLDDARPVLLLLNSLCYLFRTMLMLTRRHCQYNQEAANAGVWKTMWRKGDFWKHVDLLRVAKAAARHGAPYTSLFFLELWSDSTRPNAVTPPPRDQVRLAAQLAAQCNAALKNGDAKDDDAIIGLFDGDDSDNERNDDDDNNNEFHSTLHHHNPIQNSDAGDLNTIANYSRGIFLKKKNI